MRTEVITEEMGMDKVKPSWAFAAAVMDYLSPLGKEAMRRGLQEMIKDCSLQSHTPDNIQLLRELVEILAHFPS